jgi:hypothetical protein
MVVGSTGHIKQLGPVWQPRPKAVSLLLQRIKHITAISCCLAAGAPKQNRRADVNMSFDRSRSIF